MSEVLRSDIHYQAHTGVLTHRLTQPTEGLIMDRNAELRRNKGAIQDLGAQSKDGTWGRQVASIPEVIYLNALRAGFDLNCKDNKHAERELFRFLSTDEGKACLVQGD